LEISDSESKGYRNRLDIVRDILQVTKFAGSPGSRKTHIMYQANLSYKLLTRYLKEVLTAGLICKEKSYYVLTEKGNEFLQFYEDYSSKRKEIEKGINYLNSGKETLEKMLANEY